MSTVFSPAPASLGLKAATAPVRSDPLRRFDGARSLAAMLLAAAVAALVVLADQLIDTWVDGHLFLGWVTLWVVIFAGSVLFAGSARRVARSTFAALDSWSRSLAEARSEARLWDMVQRDPRLKAELILARTRDDEAEESAPTTEARDYAKALAPLGLDNETSSPALLRRVAQREMQRHAGYLPYL